MVTLRVLVVEDDPTDFELIARELTKNGFDPVCRRVDRREEFSSRLVEDRPDVIIYDHNLPHFSSAEALQITQSSGLGIPFIIVSHAIGDEDPVHVRQSQVEKDDIRPGSSGGRQGSMAVLRLVQRKLPRIQGGAQEALDRHLIVNHQDARQVGAVFLDRHGWHPFLPTYDPCIQKRHYARRGAENAM